VGHEQGTKEGVVRGRRGLAEALVFIGCEGGDVDEADDVLCL
jgi:hypothetical protein